MKVACVLVESLPVRVEVHRSRLPSGSPAILARTAGSKRVVYDFSPELACVQAGMPLQQALSHHGSAVVIEADVDFYEASFARVLAALEHRSPLVEPGEMGCAYVGLDGLEEMYGGEARLINTLINAVPGYLEPQVGVADGKFAAYVAARSAPPGAAVKVPGDTRAFLSRRPVELLPISPHLLRRLRSFGLTTMGKVASLPVGALQAQFGPEGRLMWELASGIDRSPLMPRRTEESVSERLSFLAPASSLGVIGLAVEALLERAFAGPALRGRCCRSAALDGEVYRGPPWRLRVPFREPVGDRDRACFVIRSRLEGHPPPVPLEDIHLTLSGLAGEPGRQTGLFPNVRRREQLRETMRQLEASLGRRPPIYRVREVEPWSRLPERRLALVEYAP